MNINEEKLLRYLETHVGENTSIWKLMRDCGTCSEMSEEEIENNMFEIDSAIRKIAGENGFRLNSDHNADKVLGMPWVIDLYIEIADPEKDIARIMSIEKLTNRIAMIEDEYGLFEPYSEDVLIGFRSSIPWQIKKIYDEARDEIRKLQEEKSEIIG